MIDRYSRPAMAAVFADQSRMDLWLAVEQATLRAVAGAGIAPREAANALDRLERIDAAAVREREAEIHHDMAAFVDVAAQQAPDAAGWIHYGLTSSDVVDTALALQVQRAGALVRDGLAALRAAVLRQAHVHRTTVMLGRTHGMPAEPITFGAKVAGWWHQLGRDEYRLELALRDMAVGKLSGAVGLYSGLPPEIERTVLAELGLERDPSATQVVQRDRHAALLCTLGVLASTMERIALEVRHLQRADVGEAAEPFGRSQKGSSAMPHKRNPIVAERICGLARIVRSHAEVALQNVALWHERDISHSSAERMIVPDSFGLVDYMLERSTWLVHGLQVDAARMHANVAAQRGLVSSQRVLLALVEAGMRRDDAYRAVQQAASTVAAGDAHDLPAALAGDAALAAHLDGLDLVGLCDPGHVPPGVDAVFAELPV